MVTSRVSSLVDVAKLNIPAILTFDSDNDDDDGEDDVKEVEVKQVPTRSCNVILFFNLAEQSVLASPYRLSSLATMTRRSRPSSRLARKSR